LDRNEFLQALETLLMTNLSSVLSRLCDLILDESKAYTEKMKKTGVRQLELPFTGTANHDEQPGAKTV
jgi:hypothetical protein